MTLIQSLLRFVAANRDSLNALETELLVLEPLPEEPLPGEPVHEEPTEPVPEPTSSWLAFVLPQSGDPNPGDNGGLIRCPAGYAGASYGVKHCTTLFCPETGKNYVFGGDYSGYAKPEFKGLTGDSFRSDIWSYRPSDDVWALEQGPDGVNIPWQPDWGCYAWDSLRKRFWFSAGGSTNAFLGTGVFQVTNVSGLTLSHSGGKVFPHLDTIPAGSWTVPDNATSYIEWDEATNSVAINQTGFTAGRESLYTVVAANGVAKQTSRRAYYMKWGSAVSSVDRRHYADPHHLIALDPVTMQWEDFSLATFADQIPERCVNMGNGRILSPLRFLKGMVHDPVADQLVLLGGEFAIHYGFAANKWEFINLPQNMGQAQHRYALVGRKIYCIQSRAGVDGTESYGWTYDVDTRTQTKMGAVPHQVIPSPVQSGPCQQGQLAGSSGEDIDLKYDPKRDVLWYCEVLAPCQNPYGYGESGNFVAMHCWHYKEDRWETIPIATDAANHPHGLCWGFDPAADRFFMWGTNAVGGDPVFQRPYVYHWTPTLTTEKAKEPMITSFSVTPAQIAPGESVTVAWTTENALSATLNGVAVPVNGSLVETPSVNTTYTLVITEAVSQSASVVVQEPAPIPDPIPSSDTILAPLAMGAPIEYGGTGTSAPAPDPGGVRNITNAWNGAAFDYANRKLYLAVPGGHGDRYQNESFEIEVPWGPSRRIHDQTPFPPDEHINGYTAVDVNGNPLPGTGYELNGRSVTPITGGVFNSGYGPGVCAYKDGQPCSRHTYGGNVWLPTQQRIWLVSGSITFLGSGDVYSGWLDPVTGVWERKANIHRGFAGISADYDAARDRVIWGWGGVGLYAYDPATDTHTKLLNDNFDPVVPGSPFWSLKVVGDYVYAIHKGGVKAHPNSIIRWNLAVTTKQKWEPITVTGEIAALNGTNPGFEYDPERNALVLWAVEDPGSVTVLPFDTFAAYRVLLPETPVVTQTVNGVFGRFRRYAPNQYCLMTGASYPLTLIQL